MNVLLLTLLSLSANPSASADDFENYVMPVLTKSGCNNGACHGAAVGRGGFKLSLYGSDEDADYTSIVQQLQGRRANLVRPDESLILLKATGSMEHEGGTRLELDSEGYERVLKWIRDGARRGAERELVDFRVTPELHIASEVGDHVALKSMATFANGVVEDVTRWTVLTAVDATAVEILHAKQEVRSLRPGMHTIIARYRDRVLPIQLAVPLNAEPVRHAANDTANFIDRHVRERLLMLHLPMSPPADEATFIRRVTLDLTGRLPVWGEVRGFLNDDRTNKRALLIDSLLQSDAFVDYWTMQLGQWLRLRSQPGDNAAVRVYHDWLRSRVANGIGFDQITQELLTAVGDTHEVGPANFHRSVAGAREQAELFSEVFMGIQLRCANCHNHPLDRWTQDDYHGLAAVFAGVQRGRVVTDSPRGEVTHPRTGEAARPRLPAHSYLSVKGDNRQKLAEWVTAGDNPFFAKAIVNRLWKAMFGRGLVEPVDDMSLTNPATHPALLSELAQDFITHGFDVRHTLQMMATSATYARSSRSVAGNQHDDRFYSHSLIRPLSAEVLLDAVGDVTGQPEQFANQPAGTRAVQLYDGRATSRSLSILGRCSREQSCDRAGASVDGLSRQMHLFNGPLLNERVSSKDAVLAQLLRRGWNNEQIVAACYQRALSRQPDQRERAFWHDQLQGATNDESRRELLEDFVWSLLSCREFVTSH